MENEGIGARVLSKVLLSCFNTFVQRKQRKGKKMKMRMLSALHEGQGKRQIRSLLHCRQQIKGALNRFQPLIWSLILGDDV
jgi:hypothetical protein